MAFWDTTPLNLADKYYNLWGNCSFIFRIHERKQHGECFKWCKEGMTVNGANKLKFFFLKGLYKIWIILYILLFKFLFVKHICCIFIKRQ